MSKFEQNLEREFSHEQLFTQLRGRGQQGAPAYNGGAKPSEDRQYQIQHLKQKHHRMKQLALLGWKVKDIAAEIGCTPETVRNCLNSDLMKREMEYIRVKNDLETVDVRKKLERIAEQGVEVLEQLMLADETPTPIRAKIALEALSRTGYAPVVNIKGSIDHHHFSEQELTELKNNAKELAAVNVVDVEFKEATNLN